MTDVLKERYALGVADLEGPGGNVPNLILQSRLFGVTGAPPWVLLPASAIRFRAVAATDAPSFGDLTPIERAALRMIALLIETGRKSDSVFINHDIELAEMKGDESEATAFPTFELAILFADAFPNVALYRDSDNSVLAVNKPGQKVRCPIAVGAAIIRSHHEIWPNVPFPA